MNTYHFIPKKINIGLENFGIFTLNAPFIIIILGTHKTKVLTIIHLHHHTFISMRMHIKEYHEQPKR